MTAPMHDAAGREQGVYRQASIIAWEWQGSQSSPDGDQELPGRLLCHRSHSLNAA